MHHGGELRVEGGEVLHLEDRHHLRPVVPARAAVVVRNDVSDRETVKHLLFDVVSLNETIDFGR